MKRVLLNQVLLAKRNTWHSKQLTTNIKSRVVTLLSFAMLLFFGFSNNAIAQVTIGTGTSSTTNTPIVSCYGYTYSEQIYLQSEIGTSGSITSVSFYVNSLPTATVNSDSFTVYLGHTTLTDYATSTSWVGSSGMTEVFNGAVTYPAAGNWMTITLSTPFAYNNIDNLVVAVDENRPGYECSVGWAYTTAGANSSIYYRSDFTNPDPALPPSATGRTANRANIQLGGITQACPAPTAFAASSITTTGASIAWTSGSNLSNVEYGPAGFTPGTGTTLTGVTSPQTLSGFSPATAYDVYIIDDCGAGGLSIPLTGSFSTSIQGASGVTCTTPGANSTVVFTEEFDNNNAGWTGDIGSSGGNWEIPDNATSSNTGADNAHSGSNYMNYEASGGTGGSIVSPSIDLSAAVNDAELSFWMHAYGADMGTLNVGVGTSASGPFTNIFTWSGQLQTTGSAPWQNVGVSLASYVGQTIYLEFTQIDDQGGFTGDMSIDLVEVTTCLSCVAPSALAASNITSSSAEVSWTAGGSETVWDVQYGLSGFTIGTGDSMTVSNPDTIMGLLPNTTYDYYVRADCGGTSGVSGWAGPFSFTTLCAGQVSGTVTIDPNLPASSTNFQSFTDLATELNGCGISGALTVNVAAGTYNEYVTFEDVVGTSATNTITINGNGATIAYDGSGPQSATIRLRGIDHMTIDNLTIVNTESSSYGWGIHLVQAADSNTISNCTINIDQSSTSSLFAGIISTNSNTSTSSYANNANYTMVNNTTVNGGYYGIRFNGVSSGYNANNSVMNCTLNEIRFYGIYNIYQEAPMAHGNTVNFRASTTGGYGFYASQSIHGDVQSNIINGARTYGIYFVTHNQAAQNPTVRGIVANNMVTALSSGDGIYFSNADQMDVFHNTVTAENDQALWINSTTDDYDIRNNVFSISGSTYVIDLDAAPSVATETLNNNVYYNSGTGSIAQVASTNYATLVAWQTGDADQNSNSLEGDPVFAGPTDLHLLGPLADDAGDNTVGILTDIDGDTRPAAGSTIVDIGADEFTAVGGDIALTSGMVSQSGCYSNSDTAMFTIQNTIGGTVDFSTDSLVVNWDVAGPFNINSSGSVTVNSGTLASGATMMISAPGVDLSAAGNYTLNAHIEPNGANQSTVNDTLGAVSFAKSSLLIATPNMTTVTSSSDTVELAAFSPFFPNGGFFITEICHFAGASTGAPTGGKPSWLFSDDYIEITGSPGSDLGGYTLETWSTSSLTYSYTFPSGTLLSPNGTAIIGVGSAGSDAPSDFYYAASGGSFSSSTAAGRIIKDPQGNIEDAVGYSGSTVTAYTFPAAANVSSSDWSNTLLGGGSSWGIRLEGADVNSGTNWVLSATSSQDPNAVNSMVTVPPTPPVTGFNWSLDGNSIATSTSTTIGPWGANNNGTYKYVAAYNSADCGMVYDTATVVVNIPCGVVTAPFFDGFEVGNTYSSCWSQNQALGTNSWSFAAGSSGGGITTAFSGSLNARFTSTQGTQITQLITPVIDASGLTSTQLDFIYAQESWFGDQNYLNVYYRDSSNGAWNLVFSDSTEKTAWTPATVAIPSTSSTLEVAFEGIDNWGRANVVDDVRIGEAPSCIAPTNVMASATSATSAMVYWTSMDTLFQIQYDTAGFVPGMSTTLLVNNDTAMLSGLMGNTNYDYYVRAVCGPGDTSLWVGPNSFFTGYCTPGPSTVDGQGITNVTFGGINNSTGAEPGNYGDYTNLVANALPGDSLPIDVSLATGYTYNLWVWVDWNNDLDFSDANEEFYLGESSSANPTTFSSGIVIPAGATLGNKRFRLGGADVGLGSTSPSDPCYTGTWGAFEDYTLNLTTLQQIDLPITFDDPIVDYNPVSFGGMIDSIITDPTDATNMVLRQDKPIGAQTWAGTTLGGNGLANPIPFTATETYMNARIWSPDSGTAVLLKVENDTNPALSVETLAYTTTDSTWETLNFDFTNNPTGTPALNLSIVYDKISIFSQFNTGGTGKTYYVDDVQFGAFLSQVDLPITFDDPLIDYDPVSFGGMIDSLKVDPTDPTNMVLKQDKPTGAQTWAGTTIGGSGIANPVPFVVGSTVMTARVWSPDSGTAVLLKVENASTPALSVETMAYTTSAATWETLTFDFLNNPTGTPPLNFTTVYDKVSIFCEFGNAGSGKSYYIDDIEFGSNQNPNMLNPFALLSPPDMTTLLVAGPGANTVQASWESSAVGASYEWRAYLPGGSVNAPVLALPSDNGGADTNITFTISALDAVLASLGANIGDTATIMWNVKASNGTDSLFGTTPFQLSLIRGGAAVPNIVAAPVGGSGTTGLSGPNGTTATFFRAATIVTAAEYANANITSGSAIRSFGLSLNAAASGDVQGIMKVYLVNTMDASYSKGNIWDTITNDMVLVYNDTVDIDSGATTFNMTLSNNFTYMGNNVYVAYDWEQLSSPLAAGLVYRANTSIAGSIRRQASAVAPPATLLGSSSFRLEMLWGVDKPADDLGITALYALGKNPLGYGAPETIQVTVRNNGYLPANKQVSLNVTGANTFTSSAAVSLPSGGETTVSFSFSATNTGFNTIQASVPADDATGNDTGTWIQSSTSDTYGYADTTTTNLGSVGYNTGSGLLLSRYEVNGSASVTDVNIRIGDDAGTVGNTVYAVVLDTSGAIVGQSGNLVVATGDLETWVTFTISQEPVFNNESFYVGLAQTANAAAGYFPVAFQPDDIAFPNAYYTAGLTGAGLAGISGFRLLIEAVVDTPATCSGPTAFTVTPTCTDADVSWVSDTGSVSTLQWGLQGFTPGTGTFVYNATSPYSLTNLTPGTAYDIWIIDTCALGSASNWIGPVTFTTGDLPVATFISNQVPPAGRLDTVQYAFNGAPSQNETLLVWDYGDGTALDTGTVKTHDYIANGTYDVRLFAYNDCTIDTSTQTINIVSIGLDEFGINNFELYPNPNKGRFTLNGTLDVGGEITLEIRSMTGALVYLQTIDTGQNLDIDLDLTGEAAGVYQVRIVSEKGMVVKPFVIQD